METEKRLTERIMKITTQILEKHPELSKILDEMSISIPDEKKPEINVRALKDYYSSLEKLLKETTLKKTEAHLSTNTIQPGK